MSYFMDKQRVDSNKYAWALALPMPTVDWKRTIWQYGRKHRACRFSNPFTKSTFYIVLHWIFKATPVYYLSGLQSLNSTIPKED